MSIVFVYNPEELGNGIDSTDNMVYCDYCCSYVELTDDGRRDCLQCNPELGMEDEYDEDVGLHELDFNDE